MAGALGSCLPPGIFSGYLVRTRPSLAGIPVEIDWADLPR